MDKEILQRLSEMETDLRTLIQSRAVDDLTITPLRRALLAIQDALLEASENGKAS